MRIDELISQAKDSGIDLNDIIDHWKKHEVLEKNKELELSKTKESLTEKYLNKILVLRDNGKTASYLRIHSVSAYYDYRTSCTWITFSGPQITITLDRDSIMIDRKVSDYYGYHDSPGGSIRIREDNKIPEIIDEEEFAALFEFTVDKTSDFLESLKDYFNKKIV